jgi:hypothetical protein
MGKRFRIAATLAILASVAISSSQGQSNSPPVFHSAEVVSARGVPIPFNSVATGIVELRATIGKSGKVKEVKVVRELASVTDQSIQSVKSWIFKPATLNGNPVASLVTIAVVFCPYNGPGPISLAPIEARSETNAAAVSLPNVPVEVAAAHFPRDFNARQTSGTVVLQVAIGPNGQQGLVKVIKDILPMTDAAREAIKDWKFAPASIGDRKIQSNIVLAFAYRTPLIYLPN